MTTLASWTDGLSVGYWSVEGAGLCTIRQVQ